MTTRDRDPLLIKRQKRYVRDSINESNAYLPRIAAYFAIFNVLLIASAARIDADRNRLAAIRTDYLS